MLWDDVKNLNRKRSFEDVDWKAYSPYMMNRVYSMAGWEELWVAIFADRYASVLPKKVHWRLFWHAISPASRFIKYFKKPKAEKYIKCIQWHYGTNEQVALEYIQLMDIADLKRIDKAYRHLVEGEKKK